MKRNKKKSQRWTQGITKEYVGWDTFCVTINTDASFDHSKKEGAYAYWIVIEDQRVNGSGKLKPDMINDPLDAEIAAIGKAIKKILSFKYIPTAKHLRINTDCTGAIHQLLQSKEPREVSKVVRKLFGELKRSLKPKTTKICHVKGHSKGNTPRNYINNWCDKESRQHLKNDKNN